MKRSKLLFSVPLVTLASTMPIIVACNKEAEYKTYKYDSRTIADYQFVDPMGGKMSETEATNVYLSKIDKNKKILADDIAWATMVTLPNRSQNDRIMTLSVSIGNVNVMKSRITVQYDYHDELDGQESDSYYYEVVGLPIAVKYDSEAAVFNWYFSSTLKDKTDLKADSGWKITIKGKDKIKKTYNHNSSDEDLSDVESFLKSSLMVVSPLYLSLTEKE
ncbi:MAG: hypothetical protein ACOQNV_00835 [Mycoplasmoidaceae bacterium]